MKTETVIHGSVSAKIAFNCCRSIMASLRDDFRLLTISSSASLKIFESVKLSFRTRKADLVQPDYARRVEDKSGLFECMQMIHTEL